MAWTEKQKKAASVRAKARWAKKRTSAPPPNEIVPPAADPVNSPTRHPFQAPPYDPILTALIVEDHALVPGYESLDYVLRRAYYQAADGKGKERHATNLPFTAQPMQSISALLDSHNGLLYQAVKKIQESNRLPHDRAIAELLGAINYIAGAVIYLETKNADAEARLQEGA
jgi:hypothetical protein